MSINEIIMYIMVLFMIIGGIDKCIGNKLGLGEKFEEGIMAMGALAMSMVGIITIAPILAKVLSPIVVPVYTLLGADPSMFATTLLANDMGGLCFGPTNGIKSGSRFICRCYLGGYDGADYCIYNPGCFGNY